MKTIHRWFYDSIKEIFLCETTKWISVSLDHPKGVSVAQLGVGLWLLIGVASPAYDTELSDNTYEVESYMHTDENMFMSQRDKKTTVIEFNAVNVFTLPLKPGYTQITMAQYNNKEVPTP